MATRWCDKRFVTRSVIVAVALKGVSRLLYAVAAGIKNVRSRTRLGSAIRGYYKKVSFTSNS
jgi:hypothetical protein